MNSPTLQSPPAAPLALIVRYYSEQALRCIEDGNPNLAISQLSHAINELAIQGNRR